MWIKHNYPDDVSWHLPLNVHTLRPGLRGAALRLLSNTHIRQWAASGEGELSAVVFWQATAAHADSLWLAAPKNADDSTIQALLAQVAREVIPPLAEKVIKAEIARLEEKLEIEEEIESDE